MDGSKKSTSKLTWTCPPKAESRSRISVDAAHIVDGHAASYDMVFLGSIDGSHAELDNPRGIDHRHLIAQPHQAPGTMTSNNGDRHAVDVAGGRGVRRVEVGVGVQPDDREGPLH